MTVGELYDGAFGSSDPDKELAIHRRFLRSFTILNLNDPIMTRFAEIRALLRRRGELIPNLDLIVGATALQYDLTVLTRDLHFRRIPELKIYESR